MARIKRYHDQEEIAHLWFHQTRDHAVTRSGNFYFHGDVIYSYGAHFPIARLIKIRGQQAVLFTTRRYSNTTSKHIWTAWHAIPKGTPIFNVGNVIGNNILTQLKARLKPIWDEVQEKRNKHHLIEQFNSVRDEALEYIRLSRKKSSVWAPPDFEDQNKLALVYEEKREVRESIKREAREQKRLEDDRISKLNFDQRISVWLAGKCSTHLLQRTGHHPGEIYVRLVKNKRIIETSLGAQVSVEAATRLWRLANFCRKHQKEVQRNEKFPIFVIGGFTLDWITKEGNVKIGCHQISWSVMSEMATKLDVQDETHDPGTPFPVAATAA